MSNYSTNLRNISSRSYRAEKASGDWQDEMHNLKDAFDSIDNEQSEEDAILSDALFADKQQNVLMLLDIAKRYLQPLEAEILFLFMRNRRNKDISMILNIQEPEVARYKKIIIKKCLIFGIFCYIIHISQYSKYIAALLGLNEKQERVFKLFLEFRSLSYISEHVDSKSSNMHRSLNAIKKRIVSMLPKHPELKIVVDFYNYSKYINNNNPETTIVSDIV